MKCVCLKTPLSEIVTNVSRVIAAKSSIPALEGIQIKAFGNQLTLTGYDLESGITTTIDADIEREGEIVLPAKLFSDMIRRMTGETLEISVGERYVTGITGGNARFDIVGIASEEFPEMPSVEEDTVVGIPQSTLRSMIDQTIFAVAQTDTKPVHTGSLFDIRNGSLTVVSVDGYRLALREEKIEGLTDARFVVPGKVLGELSKLLRDDSEQPVFLTAGKRHIVFKVGSYSVISRLLEGDFLDYSNSIPKGGNTVVKVGTRVLIESVERASLLISDRLRSPLKLAFSADGAVKVSCSSPLGKAYDEVPCVLEGEETEMGFNNRYLLDALKAADCDELRIEISGSLSPIKILPPEGSNSLSLVLPVRLKNEP